MEATALKLEPVSRSESDVASLPPESTTKTLNLAASFREKLLPLAATGTERGNTPRRDWSSALDLVNEAFEAIRMSEERAVAAEEYQQQLIHHHDEQIKAIENKLASSERRLELAEIRAKDAEVWLNKFHDTIVNGFQRTFVSKDLEPR